MLRIKKNYISKKIYFKNKFVFWKNWGYRFFIFLKFFYKYLVFLYGIIELCLIGVNFMSGIYVWYIYSDIKYLCFGFLKEFKRNIII